MNFNIPIICFDVPTNRETTQNKSVYFSNSETLANIINNLTPTTLETIRTDLYKIAKFTVEPFRARPWAANRRMKSVNV